MRRVLAIGVLAALLAAPSAAAAGPAQRPELPALTLRTLDGTGSVAVDSFRGRPVLLSFWASWCGPCRVELPELESLYKELLGDGFVLLTVNVDSVPAIASRYLAQLGVSVPVYRMDQQDLIKLDINALPTNILLGREGQTLMFSTGYSPTVAEDIRRLVREMGSVGAAGLGDVQGP
ncbi:MAG TPA: TlpA disulfide reductase family protein [Thermoanaerobaculales bacterium]|nr:TlpA disulfide reductase family protein [Thermoanaerobaculales bacterium]